MNFIDPFAKNANVAAHFKALLMPTLWNSLKDLGIYFKKKKNKTTRLACIHNHIFYAGQLNKCLILVLSILGVLHLVF